MSEIKPAAQVMDVNGSRCAIEWFDSNCRSVGTLLYSAAAYEALQKENERLTNCLIAANANHEQFERQYYLELNKVEDLTESNAAQAKRIADLEHAIGCTRSHPHENMNEVCQLKTVYAKQIFNEQSEIESLRKQVKLYEETQSNELVKMNDTVKELLGEKRKVTDILLLRIDPIEIVERVGSVFSASKNGE